MDKWIIDYSIIVCKEKKKVTIVGKTLIHFDYPRSTSKLIRDIFNVCDAYCDLYEIIGNFHSNDRYPNPRLWIIVNKK